MDGTPIEPSELPEGGQDLSLVAPDDSQRAERDNTTLTRAWETDPTTIAGRLLAALLRLEDLAIRAVAALETIAEAQAKPARGRAKSPRS